MMSELSLSYQRAHHRAMEKVRVRLTLSAAGLGRLSAHRVRVRHMFEHTAFCSSASGGVRCGLSVQAPLLRDAALTKNRNDKRQTTAVADSTPPPPRRAVLGGSTRLASIFYALTQSFQNIAAACTSGEIIRQHHVCVAKRRNTLRGTKYTTYVVTAVHDCAQ
jgi:hypothetical protein